MLFVSIYVWDFIVFENEPVSRSRQIFLEWKTSRAATIKIERKYRRRRTGAVIVLIYPTRHIGIRVAWANLYYCQLTTRYFWYFDEILASGCVRYLRVIYYGNDRNRNLRGYSVFAHAEKLSRRETFTYERSRERGAKDLRWSVILSKYLVASLMRARMRVGVAWYKEFGYEPRGLRVTACHGRRLTRLNSGENPDFPDAILDAAEYIFSRRERRLVLDVEIFFFLFLESRCLNEKYSTVYEIMRQLYARPRRR